MVVILFFCTPELSSLLKQVTSDYVRNDFLIASKALDGGGGGGSSHGPKKSFWSIVAGSYCCTQHFKRPIWRLILLFEGSNAQIFKQIWVIGSWNNYTGFYTARGAHKCEKCHFDSLARQLFFHFLESRWLWLFTEFDKSAFFSLHCMVYVMTRNTEKQKNMVQILPVTVNTDPPVWPLLVQNYQKGFQFF